MSQRQGTHSTVSESTKVKPRFRRETNQGWGRLQKRFHGEGDARNALWKVERISTGRREKWSWVFCTEGLARSRQSSIIKGEYRIQGMYV